jgi:hypothetical protein
LSETVSGSFESAFSPLLRIYAQNIIEFQTTDVNAQNYLVKRNNFEPKVKSNKSKKAQRSDWKNNNRKVPVKASS